MEEQEKGGGVVKERRMEGVRECVYAFSYLVCVCVCQCVHIIYPCIYCIYVFIYSSTDPLYPKFCLFVCFSGVFMMQGLLEMIL